MPCLKIISLFKVTFFTILLLPRTFSDRNVMYIRLRGGVGWFGKSENSKINNDWQNNESVPPPPPPYWGNIVEQERSENENRTVEIEDSTIYPPPGASSFPYPPGVYPPPFVGHPPPYWGNVVEQATSEIMNRTEDSMSYLPESSFFPYPPGSWEYAPKNREPLLEEVFFLQNELNNMTAQLQFFFLTSTGA